MSLSLKVKMKNNCLLLKVHKKSIHNPKDKVLIKLFHLMVQPKKDQLKELQKWP